VGGVVPCEEVSGVLVVEMAQGGFYGCIYDVVIFREDLTDSVAAGCFAKGGYVMLKERHSRLRYMGCISQDDSPHVHMLYFSINHTQLFVQRVQVA
jgi:hypothetical protein